MNAPLTLSALAREDFHNPVFVFRKHVLRRAAHFFTQNFQGNILYAVKTNPDPLILTQLRALGITRFDVASLEEVTHVSTLLPEAELFFMHPVKSRHAIREAYYHYGVRHFALDSEDELQKILQETDGASDLSLLVRLAIPNSYAELNLAEKFGINLQDAPTLLQSVAHHAEKTGICFHTGSQCMHPDAFRIAMRMAAGVIRQAEVPIAFFDVGGGFPSVYPGMIPPDMQEFFDAIHSEYANLPTQPDMQLIAEPGRALVAECMSLLVRVEQRKDNMLYINDGTYGSLFDAGTPGFIFPVRLLRGVEKESSNLVPFSFYGPTCDSLDFMKGPFYLPSDIQEGDRIEIGQLGAYSRTMITGFNGFRPVKELVEISDEPLMTMYSDSHTPHQPLEVIAA